jgi:hypothetical protein
MPPDETGPAVEAGAAASRHDNHALIAALGNATALGLGYLHLQRWGLFAANLTGTGIVVWNLCRSDPPPPRFWWAALIAIVLVTVVNGWRAGRHAVADADDGPDVDSRSGGPVPFRGRGWTPVSLTVLAAYAIGYSWINIDAARLHTDQTALHAQDDCEAAVAQADRLHRGHLTLAIGWSRAVHDQARACKDYLTAMLYIADDEAWGEPWNATQVVDLLEFYLASAETPLEERAAHHLREYQVELLLRQLLRYSAYIPRDVRALAVAVDENVDADPGSAHAARAAEALDEVDRQWRADAQSADAACGLYYTASYLLADEDLTVSLPVPWVDMPDSGPVVSPLVALAEELRPEAAFGCAQGHVEQSEDASDPDEAARHLRRAAAYLAIVVAEYPDHERATAAEELLDALDSETPLDD